MNEISALVSKAGNESLYNAMKEKRKYPPPGETILESMKFLKMTREEFAFRLGVTEKFLEDLIQAKEPLGPSLADSLESLTGSPANFWKMLESKYRNSL